MFRPLERDICDNGAKRNCSTSKIDRKDKCSSNFLYIGQIFDKDNLKAKNNAIFVLEREFLDLRKTILFNSKITL